jgi:hypothetical protein
LVRRFAEKFGVLQREAINTGMRRIKFLVDLTCDLKYDAIGAWRSRSQSSRMSSQKALI